jgi:hypothetical protein
MRRAVIRRSTTVLAASCAVAALGPAVPAQAAAPATAIVLERAGGFAGRQDTFLVDRSTVDGQRSLRLVERAGFRRLRAAYLPDNACCDRFSYRLTVTYRGGRHKTVSTVQGTTAPRVLWDVITEVERVGARSPQPV